ncbi:HAMP domain-containing sensor histidine kinase [Cyanobacterium aponinum UTEX 3221]|uniref:sensor histidine kinase n=1 Tax=Cyanobacterium aponinum TaxID=379064 RepID=UPI002B4BB623|nr:HAMP domain-containing sensor histidine kinase [Cyanobacterium aponinum]WRL38758.1 HAMP domain-containing sensor histidine kinase [Cyanobacterium aponinum UTEX 3221]
MDGIFEPDIAETAEILKFDRILVLKFKYNHVSLKNITEILGSTKVEILYQYNSSGHNGKEKSELIYDLLDSPLTTYAWKKAPEIIKISSKKQLEKLGILEDIEKVFFLDLTKSLVIVPLFKKRISNNINKPLILGLYIIQNNKEKRWSNAEIELAKWMAKKITNSIVNEQAFLKVQSLVDERTSQLQVSLEVQAKLGQKLRNYVEELRRVNKIKDEFIASLSDALKTPLANMKMGIKMLKLLNKNEQSIRYLDILADECEKEINLVNNLLALQTLESNNIDVESQKIYLQPLLGELYNFFSQELHYKQINLVIDSSLDYLYTDLNSLNLILRELINNACKFSYEDTDIILRIYEQNSDNIIEVTNCGFPISIAEESLISQPFYQGSRVENVTNSGTGLGLALVQSLVQNLNGIITVESNPSSQTDRFLNTFVITFPNFGKVGKE